MISLTMLRYLKNEKQDIDKLSVNEYTENRFDYKNIISDSNLKNYFSNFYFERIVKLNQCKKETFIFPLIFNSAHNLELDGTKKASIKFHKQFFFSCVHSLFEKRRCKSA